MLADSAAPPLEALEPRAVAASGGLRYVTDSKPGITRRRRGKTFTYYDAKGKAIRDTDELARIRGIGIPPAYENVWICPQANGHIQATGIDARGRKQYRYHAKWREVRDRSKFEHVLSFGAALPQIRAAVAQHLRQRSLSRERVLATVVSLLEKTLIRVGNAEYAKSNESFGLTTLQDQHVDVKGARISFKFTGKSGKSWNLSITDRRIASVVKGCADIDGYELFKYVDENGTVHDVGSTHVNDYLREITGQDFTAKDFRTWAGTVLAAELLCEAACEETATQANKTIVAAIDKVAGKLGNTRAICRKCYIHPAIFESYIDGSLAGLAQLKATASQRTALAALTGTELNTLLHLRKRLEISAEARH